MTTATLPLLWQGRSGRTYLPVPRSRVRHGAVATVRKVIGRGPPVGPSTVPEGEPLALKAWLEEDEGALEVLQQEARLLTELNRSSGDLPCPRLYDLIGEPVVTGLVLEWCPGDLERWWRDKLTRPDAFGRLMAAMAEVSRRVGEAHDLLARAGAEGLHGDLKPGNVLMAMSGRWLVTDLGGARVRPPEDSPWAPSDVVVGTENFLAPEVLFHARRAHPAAIDTWALAGMVFALLRLQRMVLDAGPVPRNGTASPRFGTARQGQVLDLYRREPTRFFQQDLDPGAFSEPLKLPQEDRRAVREALRGTFGDEDDAREAQLSEALLEVLDRALSIDPAHRYTTARGLAAAFEHLTREYIALSAPHLQGTPVPVEGRELEETRARAEALEGEVLELQARLREAEIRAHDAEETAQMRLAEHTRRLGASEAPSWGVAVLLGVLALQVLTLLGFGILAGWFLWALG